MPLHLAPCRASPQTRKATRGPVRIGDLPTSEREGWAMRSEPIAVGGRKIHAPGTVVGKALEPLAGGRGEILVLLTLQ